MVWDGVGLGFGVDGGDVSVGVGLGACADDDDLVGVGPGPGALLVVGGVLPPVVPLSGLVALGALGDWLAVWWIAARRLWAGLPFGLA